MRWFVFLCSCSPSSSCSIAIIYNLSILLTYVWGMRIRWIYLHCDLKLVNRVFFVCERNGVPKFPDQFVFWILSTIKNGLPANLAYGILSLGDFFMENPFNNVSKLLLNTNIVMVQNQRILRSLFLFDGMHNWEVFITIWRLLRYVCLE